MPATSTTRTTIQQKRRAEIIDAAIAALAEVGYVATSFAEIGNRVGISKSVVAYLP
jgi:TetR/AcrR family fatty acid metabolism transcriptional regulator